MDNATPKPSSLRASLQQSGLLGSGRRLDVERVPPVIETHGPPLWL